MYSVRGKDGEQNGTICSGTYLGRKTGIFFNPGSSELADGAVPVQVSDAFDPSKPFPEYRWPQAKSIRFYLEYLDEKEMELSQVAELEFQEQYEHYVGFLHWLKAGNHLHEKKEKLPSNKTCNAYLKDVFRFFCF